MRTFSRLLLGLLTAAIFTGSALALTVPVSEDTYFSPSKTGTNLAASSGAAVSLPVNVKDIALINFDLGNANNVPPAVSGTDVTSAILQLYVVSALPAGDLTIPCRDLGLERAFHRKARPGTDDRSHCARDHPGRRTRQEGFCHRGPHGEFS